MDVSINRTRRRQLKQLKVNFTDHTTGEKLNSALLRTGTKIGMGERGRKGDSETQDFSEGKHLE